MSNRARRDWLKVVGTVSIVGIAGCSSSEETEPDEETATDSETNRIEGINPVGIVNSSASTVDMIKVTVRPAPGTGNINMGATTIQMGHSSGSYDLTYNDGDDADNTGFSITTVRDDDSSIEADQVLNDAADRANVHINADAIISDVDDPTESSGNGLEEGDDVVLRLLTPSGGVMELRLAVPEKLSGKDAVQL